MLTRDNLEDKSSGVILVDCLRSSLDVIPNGRSLSTKILLGSAPAELVNGFRLLAWGSRSARQFEGFVYVDGQLGKRTRTLSGSISRKIGKCSKWGSFVVALDTERTCVNPLISGPGR